MNDDIPSLFDDAEDEEPEPEENNGQRRMDDAREESGSDGLRDPREPRPGPVGNKHPDSSRKASYLSMGRAGSHRHRLVIAFYEERCNPRPDRVGLNCAEATAITRGPSRNQTSTRMGELRDDGWLERVTEDRFPGMPLDWPTDDDGNVGDLHVLTAQGFAKLHQDGAAR